MIEALDVFKAFQPHRGKAIVSASGIAGRHWRDVSTDEKRDVALGGAMGHTTPAALGLALGLPDEKVMLFDSEGALLMNLGVMATIAGLLPSFLPRVDLQAADKMHPKGGDDRFADFTFVQTKRGAREGFGHGLATRDEADVAPFVCGRRRRFAFRGVVKTERS